MAQAIQLKSQALNITPAEFYTLAFKNCWENSKLYLIAIPPFWALFIWGLYHVQTAFFFGFRLVSLFLAIDLLFLLIMSDLLKFDSIDDLWFLPLFIGYGIFCGGFTKVYGYFPAFLVFFIFAFYRQLFEGGCGSWIRFVRPASNHLTMPRTIVIGDIHGCYDELMELLQQVELKDEDFLLSLGDIVDRGNKSLEVYQFFKNRPNSKVLMGNHERKHLNGQLNYAQEIVKVQFGSEYSVFLEWLKKREYAYETTEAIIVHAAFEPTKPLSEQKDEVLCGSTSGERYLTQKLPAESHWQDTIGVKSPLPPRSRRSRNHPQHLRNR